MGKQNYISPKTKKKFQTLLGKLSNDYIFYTCGAVNGWFKISYPQIGEVSCPRREYCRLYCQYLWRQIADQDEIDHSEAILNLINLVNQEEKFRKDPSLADATNAIKALDKILPPGKVYDKSRYPVWLRLRFGFLNLLEYEHR